MKTASRRIEEATPDEIEELLATQRAVLAEVQSARQPGYNQPQQTVRRFQQQAKGAQPDLPFNSLGDLCAAVAQCKGAVGSHPEMQRYARSMDSWLRSPQASGYAKALPTGMNETVGTDGGVLVAPQFVNQLLMRMYSNDLLSRTTMIPLTGSNQLKVPAVHETSRANGSRFGGVTSYWRAEAGTVDASKLALKTVNLTLNSAMVLVRVTEELLADAPAMATYLDTVVYSEMGFRVGHSIVRGSGTDQPQGLLNSPSKIAISKEAGQAAVTINSSNVLKMWSRLHPSCWANAVWLYDQSIFPQLATMTIGTAGSQLAAYLPAGGLSGNPYPTLLGKPMLVTEFNPALGTEGDLILTDLATVLSATQGGVQTAASMHIYFLTNEQAFRFVLRIDARNWWLSSLTPFSAGDTQSNIITIATRS